MADNTMVECADASWPVVQGCSIVSAGCKNCYAVNVVNRLAGNPRVNRDGILDDVVAKNSRGRMYWTGKVALRHDRLDWPMKWKKGRRIFVPSHGDLFHEDVPDEFIDKIFAVMALTPRHTYQLLTKRPERMLEYMNSRSGLNDDWGEAANWITHRYIRRLDGALYLLGEIIPPLPNVWLGVSVENQHWFDIRWPLLRDTPAAVRFISYEPALKGVNFRLALRQPWLCEYCYAISYESVLPPDWDLVWHSAVCPNCQDLNYTTAKCGCRASAPDPRPWRSPLDLIILGGESGPGARPMQPEWVRSVRDQCVVAGAAFFFKQWGGARPGGEALLDGREWREFPKVAEAVTA